MSVQTAYGLTETYGPISFHIPYQHRQPSDGTHRMLLQNYDNNDACEHSAPISQQRVYQVFNATVDAMTVLDPSTMEEVPRNGSTMGEVKHIY